MKLQMTNAVSGALFLSAGNHDFHQGFTYAAGLRHTRALFGSEHETIDLYDQCTNSSRVFV